MVDTGRDFKEQMTEARRTQILMGAAQIFAEKGFHKATTKEIAKAAGVSEGTIYNYFDNKRELLVAMIELIGMSSLKSLVMEHLSQEPGELFTVVLRDRYQLVEERGYLIAPLIAEVFTDEELREELYRRIVLPFSSYLERYIQTRIESGQFRQINPIIATRALVGGAILNFVLASTSLDSRYEDISVESIIEQLVSFYLGGILADEHEK